MNDKPKRRIRSFVKREGRMTDRQRSTIDQKWEQYGLDVGESLIDFEHIFGRVADTVLEIGFGMGHSLLTMAKQYPEKNYIGIEVHRPGVGTLMAGLEQDDVNNVRVYCHDAVEVLKKAIPDNSLAAVQIYFPDPWPKKKHHKRRLVQDDFIQLIVQKLQPNGLIHCATDWENYAEQMMEVLSANNSLQNQAGEQQFSKRPKWRPETKFEARGKKLGHGIWDLIFAKE